MVINSLFYLVFLSQLILISIYFPKKMISRMVYVRNNFPRTIYPKLYPSSIEAEEQGIRRFSLMNNTIATIGFVLLLGYFFMSFDSAINLNNFEAVPLFFGMLQFLPFGFLELSACKQLKLMRQANTKSTRKADLNPRRLFDFTSPYFVLTAVVLFVVYLSFEFYFPNSNFHWDKDGLIRVVTLLICNLLFAVIIFSNLSGKKRDPHQSNKDRVRQISFTIKSLILTSIAVSLFFIVTILIDDYQLDYLSIIINSLYFQFIAISGIGTMLNMLKIEEMDFSVYKQDVVVN